MTASSPLIWELPDAERPVEGVEGSGAPDPAYAAALGLVTAPPGRRAAAAAIDIAVFAALQVTFVIVSLPLFVRLLRGRITWYGFVNHPDFLVSVIVAGVTLLLTILFVVAQLVMQGKWGFTLGKLATGLRTVNVRSLAAPGVARGAWRALVAWVPLVTVVGTPVVLASPLWSHDRSRGWHDGAGDVWVVDARHGLDPFDRKRMRIARKAVTSAAAPPPRSLPSLATDNGSHVDHVYRPGARTSAGVLGAARPHAPFGRVTVGLAASAPGKHAASTESVDTGPVTVDRQQPLPQPAQQPASPPVPQPVPQPAPVTLLLDNGQRIQVTGAVVLGRSPVPVDGALPVSIDDPGSSISKTHVVVRRVDAGVEVIDRGSTNGTALVSNGHQQLLPAGEVGVARPGDTIRIGDRTVRVLID